MKKYVLVCILFTGFFAFTPVSANALDMSIGAAGWYTKWQLESDRGDKEEFEQAPIYGPLFSIRFAERWSFSTVFLYGKFNEKHDDDTDTFHRFDSDSALKYKFNSYIKFFLGLKFMGYYWDAVGDNKGRHQSLGPGLGIGLTVPLKNNFYLLYSISALYARGDHRTYNNDPGYVQEFKTDINEYIFNTTLSTAYYIKPASTIITLGFRYQYIKSDLVDENSSNNDVNMIFYGVIVTAMYSFNI